MVKELFHICRTYFVTFRYLKKHELQNLWTLTFIFIILFFYSFIII